MWKGLLIVALLCAAPVPRQSVQAAAKTRNDSRPQSQVDVKPAYPLATVNGAKQTEPAKPHREEAGADTKDKEIAVASLPAVTIVEPKKSFWDELLVWGPWGFNLLLVGVGGLQVWLLFKTLGKVSDQETRMGEQVIEMKTQATHMTDQLAEMKRQADAMDNQNKNTRDRERARLSVFALDKPTLLARTQLGGDADNSVPILIRLDLVNDGTTKAFNIRGFGVMDILSKFDENALPTLDNWFKLQLPGTFRESGTEHCLSVTVTQLGGITDSDYTFVSEKLLQRIQSKEVHLEISGLIAYDDVYGDHHETPFRFLWVQEGGDHGGDWWDSSHWINYSGKST